MTSGPDSAYRLVEIIRRKAPEYLDLLTAESDEQFESAFDALLAKAITLLESNSVNFKDLNEEGLSGILAAALSIPGLTVSQETNSNGHVDLTIEADHCTPPRRKLGEAKIYRGPAYHIGGLEQLLDRYTTGRESRGILIVYVRSRDISGLVSKLRATMDETLPCKQKGKTGDHMLRWSFLSIHGHSCGDDVQIEHVGCNLHVTGGD